jgi:hypothetical protein
MICSRCGKDLTANETGLSRKLINRGAQQYQCLGCLAGFFGCSTDLLREKIAQFRRQGCALFASQSAAEEPER